MPRCARLSSRGLMTERLSFFLHREAHDCPGFKVKLIILAFDAWGHFAHSRRLQLGCCSRCDCCRALTGHRIFDAESRYNGRSMNSKTREAQKRGGMDMLTMLFAAFAVRALLVLFNKPTAYCKNTSKGHAKSVRGARAQDFLRHHHHLLVACWERLPGKHWGACAHCQVSVPLPMKIWPIFQPGLQTVKEH